MPMSFAVAPGNQMLNLCKSVFFKVGANSNAFV